MRSDTITKPATTVEFDGAKSHSKSFLTLSTPRTPSGCKDFLSVIKFGLTNSTPRSSLVYQTSDEPQNDSFESNILSARIDHQRL